MDGRISSSSGTAAGSWQEAWESRDLLFVFVRRTLSRRYERGFAGVLARLAGPLALGTALTLVFGSLAGLPSAGIPYPLLVAAGLLPWLLFAGVVRDASAALVENAALTAQVRFPRVLLPVSALVVGLVEAAAALAPLAILMFLLGVAPTWRLAVVPLVLGGAGLLAVALGLLLAPRVERAAGSLPSLPFGLPIMLYVSPIGFSALAVPESWRGWYSVNPLVGLAETMRWAVGGVPAPTWPAALGVSISAGLLLLLLGFRHFARSEQRNAADGRPETLDPLE